MSDVKTVAFFLPQFHPTPENDRWWGKGFTEWVGVTRARPLFPGHHQPRLPADLGFYDLRLPEVRSAQAELARAYGIDAFCWYYYWFGGKRLLHRPLDEMLRSGDPDFPFCICWANENWTRRWNGAEHEILIAQEHSPASDRRFIEDVLPILRDPRYLRVNGAPLLLVYRAQLLPDAPSTTALWREVARREGVGELHLAAVQSFWLDDPTALGFDAAVEFPPHGHDPAHLDPAALHAVPGFEGELFSYPELARAMLARPRTTYRRFPGVMTAWDNTARRGRAAHVFHGATPEVYEQWLRAAVERARHERPPGERLVFVNAWNEWGEGAYLEPDQRHGHAWLEATARAVGKPFVRTVAPALRWAPDEGDGTFAPGPPPGDGDAPEATGGVVHLDAIQGAKPTAAIEGPGGPARVHARHGVPLSLSGWALTPPLDPAAPAVSSSLVLLAPDSGARYHLAVRRIERDDVAAQPDVERRLAERSGFDARASIDAVAPGRYRLGLRVTDGGQAITAWTVVELQVEGAATLRRAPRSLAAPDPVAPGALRCGLDGDLSRPVVVGAGQVLRLSGFCHHPAATVRGVEVVVDGEPHPAAGRRVLRPDVGQATAPADDPGGRALESGFVALVPLPPIDAPRTARLAVRARLVGGAVIERTVGSLPLAPGSRLAAALAPAPHRSPAEAEVVICMATYDPPPDLLESQLDSIVAQTHTRWTCIVNDDASPEPSYRALQRLAARDPRFTVHRNRRRLGFRGNFEACLARVPPGADFVALSDQDDRWFPEKLATCLAAFGPETQLVYSDMHVVTRDDRLLSPTFWTSYPNNWDDLLSLLHVNTVTGAASVFRASLLADVLPFPPPDATPFHDHWIATAALAKGAIEYVDRPLYAYRQHGRNALGHPAPRRGLRAGRIAALAREPRRIRTAARGELERLARAFHEDVLRVAQLAQVLALRFPDAAAEKRDALELASRVAVSPASAARVALECLAHRPGGTAGTELRLLGAHGAVRALAGWRWLARQRAALGGLARRSAARRSLPAPGVAAPPATPPVEPPPAPEPAVERTG